MVFVRSLVIKVAVVSAPGVWVAEHVYAHVLPGGSPAAALCHLDWRR